MSNVVGRVVFISGASSGFGEACARRFAGLGCHLILCARRKEKLQSLRDELQRTWPQLICHVVCMDVCDEQVVSALPESLPEELRAVDILVNNAGLALGLEPAWQASVNDWNTMLDTNCRALVSLTRRFLPSMVARNTGHVINIGSTAGQWPYPGANVYGATKAFVKQFSLNLRSDLLGKQVRVTNIEPGMAHTEFSKVRFHGDDSKSDAVYQGTQPLSAEDVAESVVWVAGLPDHVNVNTLELMPTVQAWGPLAVSRDIEGREPC